MLNTYFARYYDSLDDINIKAFNLCLSGDLSALSKNKYYTEEKAAKFWLTLFDKHLHAHGLPDNFVEYLQKKIKACKTYNKAYNGKPWEIVRARLYDAEAELLNQGGEGASIDEVCAEISKFYGFPILAHTCPVNVFYGYVERMKR